MSKQRYVQDSFWTDPYIENLDPSEKLLFIYFLTNPLCNIAGIYEIRNNRIAYETGFDKDMVDKIKGRFIKDGKILTIDNWILIVNFAKNQATNPSVLAGMQRIIDELPPWVQAVTGFDRLSHFTLLNLTLPNSTLRGSEQAVPAVKMEKKTTYNTLGEEIIKAFETVDPKNKTMYGNTTQRKACDFLLSEYGLEKVLRVIEILPQVNQQKLYIAQITTPYELQQNWVKLGNLLKQKKSETITKNKIAF